MFFTMSMRCEVKVVIVMRTISTAVRMCVASGLVVASACTNVP